MNDWSVNDFEVNSAAPGNRYCQYIKPKTKLWHNLNFDNVISSQTNECRQSVFNGNGVDHTKLNVRIKVANDSDSRKLLTILGLGIRFHCFEIHVLTL
jgi:hypothetical protein